MESSVDTIAALATPVGVSALAVVRASGPACSALARALLGREPRVRLAYHLDYYTTAGLMIDDVLLTYFAEGKSYTGEAVLEISCHGNPYLAQKILEDLLVRGCRMAEPGEFTRRAFLNGKMDLSQAEAVMDLIHARSERALTAANQQLRGSLGRHLDALIEVLIGALAHVEAYIDFPDEDLPPEDRKAVGEAIDKLSAGAERLLATEHYGQLLRDGLKTVILGEPNAGKSSLLNQLVGRDRALVSPEPGTTRDFLEERLLLGPHCIRLIDTAGLNPRPAGLERQGMAKTLERAAEADLLLWVVDGTRPPPPVPGPVSAAPAAVVLTVLNKCDCPMDTQTAAWLEPRQPLRLSALNGEGCEELRRELVARAEAFRTDHGPEVLAINARHADALRRARLALEAAGAKLRDAQPVELLASDLRAALDDLGEIGGPVDHERVLDRLFATFCIGK